MQILPKIWIVSLVVVVGTVRERGANDWGGGYWMKIFLKEESLRVYMHLTLHEKAVRDLEEGGS